MFKSRFQALFLAALILASIVFPCLAVAKVAALEPGQVDVLISYYSEPTSNDLATIVSLGGTVKKVYEVVPVVSATVPSSSISVLEAYPNVKCVEYDITISFCIAGQSLPWGVDRIDAELVHLTNKGAGVKIAVLDTGIDLDHPDLNVAGNVCLIIPGGPPTGDDDNGHGTLVAGIIAARNNTIGVVGVAPEASIYAVKVLNSEGSGAMSVILSGIEWSIQNNMNVINFSFGSIMNWPTSIIDALNNAYNAGIVIIAGAGNSGDPSGEGENIWAPARYSSVIAVGATDELDNRVSNSSTGAQLEVMAPGLNIPSTAMGGGYGFLSYTSASAPHASGTAALAIAGGAASNLVVRQALIDTAQDIGAPGWDSQYGWGLINAQQVVAQFQPGLKGLYDTKDALLRKDAKNTNEGANPAMAVQRKSNVTQRSVVAFDLSTVPTSGLVWAKLVFTLTEPVGETCYVDAHRLTQSFTEGNGSNWNQTPPIVGSGAGATWYCPNDPNISNNSTDGAPQWDGGWTFAAPATAPAVYHTAGMTGEVTWNVTADVAAVLGSASEISWLVKLNNEALKIDPTLYYTREGAGAVGNPHLSPRLILQY